ncbi:Pr6Pr family membrane protein [Microbacterium sp. 18062]|uniref:Pr6Pr family membrane protein n=1 Tax=Microbacterium sp. 18062 TaxID=2681410 RepID=UPI00135B7080|nr:Pr6Pr family membrane protein [Microbacterium sp. 18062]
MYVPDRRLALAYRLAAAVVVLWGVGRVSGLFDGRPSGVQFLYFTVLSNILCLTWLVLLAIRTIRDLRAHGPRGASTPSARFSLAVVFSITVTMLVYLIVLVPETFTQGNGYTPFTLTDNLVHIVAPCLLIGDWLLFVPKGRSRWFDPLAWALIPLAYVAFAFVYGALGGLFGGGTRYPYPFMDVDRNGVDGVVLWIVGLTAALEVVAFAYLGIDALLGALGRRTRERAPAAPG